MTDEDKDLIVGALDSLREQLATERQRLEATYWQHTDELRKQLAAERKTLELANAATQHWQRRFERKREQMDAAVEALRKMLKAVDDFADEESTDIIYGELRQEAESLLAKIGK